MAITTCSITGVLYGPSGEELAQAVVAAQLSGNDVFGPVVVPAVARAITEIDGTFQFDLWPNSAGQKGTTTYKITITHPTIKTQCFTDIVVPNQSSATLAELLGYTGGSTAPLGALQIAGGQLMISGGYLTI